MIIFNLEEPMDDLEEDCEYGDFEDALFDFEDLVDNNNIDWEDLDF